MRLLKDLRDMAPIWLIATACLFGAALSLLHPGVSAGILSFSTNFLILFFGFYGLMSVAWVIHQVIGR